jgi:GntR family transcriptional regulator/MocR family aminotransferase
MFGIGIDRSAEVSITSQVTRQLREAVQSGKLTAGTRMPPTRSLAQELAISRNTVMQAYEQLLAEGYLNARTGSGTFVADIGVLTKSGEPDRERQAPRKQSDSRDWIAFDAGNPDVSAFPRAMWAKALKSACFDAPDDAFGYGQTAGHIALREALSRYLYRSKGIFCDSERIVIVPGTAIGMEIAAQMLHEEGCALAVEDPCLLFARHAIEKIGYGIAPVEVDGSGMRVDRIPADAGVRLVYVAPSHQYPTGGVLPAPRRIALLDFAQKNGAYVIEDDYDSEFRYRGEPIQSLWHLDGERVIYLGSFSNVFSPALRMAYMILPQHLADRTLEATGALNIWVGAIEQIALARLMDQKQYDRHVYRMKRLYDAKRKRLLSCLHASFGKSAAISGEDAGLHLMLSFQRDLTGGDIRAMDENGVRADYVEDYAIMKGGHKNSLVLGYGNLSFEQIEEGVRRLKNALQI